MKTRPAAFNETAGYFYFSRVCVDYDWGTSCHCIVRELYSVTSKFPDRNFSRPRLAVFALPCGQTKTSLRLTKTSQHATKVVCCYLSFSSLWGLWLGQLLSEHLSGIVFVPSIISAPHMGQVRPVGFALMAYLQSGYFEQL